MQLAGIYADLSDTELDSRYESYYNAAQQTTGAARVAYVVAYGDMALEILDRLSSVWSFTTGVFGHTRFPKFDAIQQKTGGFVQTQAAQEGIAAQVSNVGKGIASTFKMGVYGAVGLGVAALVVLYLIKKK